VVFALDSILINHMEFKIFITLKLTPESN
jgi:hypothetical protein